MPTRKLTSSQLKQFRSDVAKLKKKGLVSGRVDARSQKPTRYMLEQVKKYDDVLKGKSTVVSTKKRKKAKEYSDRFKTKFDKVVVPKEPGERIRYSKKDDTIIGTSVRDGKKIRKRYSKGELEDLEKLPPGYIYRIQFGGGQIFSFDDKTDLIEFMHPYEVNPKNPFRNWKKYVEVVSVTGDGDDDDE